MNEPRYEVIVAGAGPSGSLLSLDLARKGIRVLVLEKALLPRHKVCAGGITVRAASLLPFDVREVTENVIFGARLSYKCKEKKSRTYEKPLVYTVMRDKFDYVLQQMAGSSGAVLKDHVRITNVEFQKDGLKVHTSAGVFFSAVLVGADGANSIVAKSIQLGGGVETGVGMEIMIDIPKAKPSRWQELMQLDYGQIPGGYGWIFPKRNCLSVGAGGPSGAAGILKPYLMSFLRAYDFETRAVQVRGHLMPVRKKGTPLTKQGILLVGDAAGMIDPLTGEGIYYALRSSLLAISPIMHYLGRRSNDLTDYERSVDRELTPELQVSRSLQRINTVNPRLFFELIKENDRCWNAFCRLLRGEKTYLEIKQALGPFKQLFRLL